MPLGRQPPCLDRVREDDRRAVFVGVSCSERSEQVGEVVAAEVAYRDAELGVGEVVQQALDLAARVPFAGQPLTQLGS